MVESRIVQFVVNPVAGRIANGADSPGGRALATLCRHVQEAGLEARVAETRRRGDARAIAAKCCEQGVRALVVVGGDGTINEAAGGMSGEGVPMLIVPTGTENILAKYLGIGLDGDSLWRILEGGECVSMDLAVLRGELESGGAGQGQPPLRRFLMVAGIGFDAQIVHEVTRRRNELLAGGSGHISYRTYVKPVWRTLWGYRHPRLCVEVDEKAVYSGPAMVLVGNVPRYAMGIRPACRARPDDGLLDVCVFECRRRVSVLRHFANVVLRRHATSRGVFYYQGRQVRIRAEDEQVPVQADGDVAGYLPAELSVGADRVKFLAPAGFRI